MANVREIFEIVDRATAPLRNIESAMSSLTGPADDLSAAISESTAVQQSASNTMAQIQGALANLATVALSTAVAFERLNSVQAANPPINGVEASVSRMQTLNNSLQQVTNSENNVSEAAVPAADKINEMGKSANQTAEKIEKVTQKANGLTSAVKRLAAAFVTFKTAQGAINLSDELSMMRTRLGNVNDSFNTTADLQNAIYQAAQRSRGEYMVMAQTVSSLKAQTGDTFGNIKEAVAFTELLNKQFKIAGTNAVGIQSTMYNLTQALSTGVLRGNDLNIVFSNAPQIVQRIADYMGVPIGKIKELAANGEITADIVKNAMLTAADDINDQFNRMPMTFSDAMQKLKNVGVKTFEPIGQMIADAVQSPEFDAALNRTSRGIITVARIGAKGFEMLGNAVKFVSDNMETLGPIIMGAAAALGIYTAITSGAAAAQAVLNAVQSASPVMWVALGIGLIVGALVAMVMWLHVTAETGHTVFGDIAGVAMGCFSVILNLLAIVANGFLTGAEMIANGWNQMVFNIQTAVIGFASGAVRAFASVVRGAENAANAIANAFISGANAAIGGINGLINAINQIPGVNLSTVGTVSAANVDHGLSDQIESLAASLDSLKPTEVNTVSLGRFDTTSVSDAFNNGFNSGAAWGDSIQNGIASSIGSLGGQMEDLMGGGSFEDILAGQNALADAINGGKDGGGKGKVGSVDRVKKVDNVKLSDEDLRVYRDLAERRYMNNIELKTLAPEINVTMPAGTSGNLSARDVADYLKRMLIEQMAAQTAVAHG